MADELLTDRALNRALLARQLLLERHPLGTAAALEHLVGLQGQAPNAPYVALWSRLEAYDPAELAELLESRAVVRTHLMRCTVHLATAPDARVLRPLTQPVMERSFATTPWAKRIAGADAGAVTAAARELLTARTLTRAQLGEALGARFPGFDPLSLAYLGSLLVPAVQPPPRGVWGRTGAAAWREIETWLGVPLDPAPPLQDVVLRYLAAFGPASPADARTWSGLTGMRAAFDALRDRLISLRGPDGRELFDLPDAPRPDPDTPAPPRFLGEFDNILLAHANRTRIMAPDRRVPLFSGNGGVSGTVLVDGFFRATWKLVGGAVAVAPLDRLTRPERAAIDEEAQRLTAFVTSC